MPKQESPICLLPARQLPLAVERIHFDQCMPTRLARFLRQHGLNVTTTGKAGLNGVKDHAQLSYARSRRRLRRLLPQPSGRTLRGGPAPRTPAFGPHGPLPRTGAGR